MLPQVTQDFLIYGFREQLVEEVTSRVYLNMLQEVQPGTAEEQARSCLHLTL